MMTKSNQIIKMFWIKTVLFIGLLFPTFAFAVNQENPPAVLALLKALAGVRSQIAEHPLYKQFSADLATRILQLENGLDDSHLAAQEKDLMSQLAADTTYQNLIEQEKWCVDALADFQALAQRVEASKKTPPPNSMRISVETINAFKINEARICGDHIQHLAKQLKKDERVPQWYDKARLPNHSDGRTAVSDRSRSPVAARKGCTPRSSAPPEIRGSWTVTAGT